MKTVLMFIKELKSIKDNNVIIATNNPCNINLTK